MTDVLHAIRGRRSARGPYDATRPLPERLLAQIVEAARWAPTAHNMQNYELVIVDDPIVLAALGAIEVPVSVEFVRESYRTLSFTPEELLARGRGLLATPEFPPSWLDRGISDAALRDEAPRPLRERIAGAPVVIVAVFDPRERAPASDGDVLGMMSLGCVLENMWLAASAIGVGFQVMSTFAGVDVAPEIKRVLAIPPELAIAFALRLGFPLEDSGQLRVRRAPDTFTHRNRFRPGHG